VKLEEIRRLMKVAGWGERLLREMSYQVGAPKCTCGRPRARHNGRNTGWSIPKLIQHDSWDCDHCNRFEHVGTHDRRYEPCYHCLNGRARTIVAKLSISHAPGHCTNCGKAKLAHLLAHGTVPQAFECVWARDVRGTQMPETRFTSDPGGSLTQMCTHRAGCKVWCHGVYHDFTADGIFPIEQDFIVTEGSVTDDVNGETATENGALGPVMLARRHETR
jgi:hypothetical protein